MRNRDPESRIKLSDMEIRVVNAITKKQVRIDPAFVTKLVKIPVGQTFELHGQKYSASREFTAITCTEIVVDVGGRRKRQETVIVADSEYEWTVQMFDFVQSSRERDQDA